MKPNFILEYDFSSIIRIVLLFLLLSIIKYELNPILEYKNINPKVSIILPVYNNEKYLKQCLESLVNQEFKNFEIICVNDGSTDNTLNILKNYESKDSRIKIINQEKKGAGAARNVALKIATGKYISFIDSDDYTAPDYLKLMYNKIRKDKADVCVCRVAREDVKNNRIFEEKLLLDFSLIQKKMFSFRDIPENFFQFTNSVSWNKMFKKSLITKNGLFYQEIERCNDYFFIYACLTVAKKITTVNKVLYTQRINHEINLHSSLYKSPFCFLEANTKLYEWLIDQGVYNILKNTFIKSFVKLAKYNAMKCRDYKDIFIKVFILVKEEFAKFQVEKYLDILDSNLKKIAKMFLYSTPIKEYENFHKNEFHMIPISMVTDNNYVLPTIISMKSMLENANNETIYKFYLFILGDLLEENSTKFLDLQKKYQNKSLINFININMNYSPSKDKVTKNISTQKYYQLDLTYLLKEESKCIFLDGDTVINKDLSELYNLNISGYYIGGIKGVKRRYKIKSQKILDISNIEQYIDSGVLLINLKELRNEDIELHSRYILKNNNIKKEFNFLNHDATNTISYDKIKILPLKYNVMKNYKIDKKEVLQNNSNFQNYFSKSELDEAYTNPAIIHYKGKIKPWNRKKCKLEDIWLKYALKTKEFKEINKQLWYEYFSKMPEEKYPEGLKDWYKEKMGTNLDLDHPKTYTEKLQWIKLYDIDELKTKLADKYLVRDFVKSKIGEKYLTNLFGVWDNFDDIDFDKLPNKFALKANHGCGFNIIVKDKSKFNKEDSKKKFEKWLGINFAFSSGLELIYKNIEPKIIAEEYLENKDNDLYDYKVWCFDGKPYYTMFLSDRKKSLKMSFYDNNWNLQPFYYSYKRNDVPIEKPDNLEELLNAARKLSEGFKHVRVDFYRLNNGTLKFGEMTFTSASGYMQWYPEEYNRIFGNLIKLPTDKN